MSNEALKISICICTHNRASDVEDCLSALMSQWNDQCIEVIIVDSASRPEHAERLVTLTHKWPKLVYIRSEIAGLSVARNIGIQAAKGEWIAFLDDDAVPFPDYIDRAIESVTSMEPDVAFFGGRLKPRWPTAEPPRIGKMWMNFLSLIDDPTPIRLTESGMIFGANLFYRRRVLTNRVTAFDPSLGRVGNCLLSGEEINLHSSLLKEGYQCRYVGTVAAEHKVSEQRLTLEWIKQRAYWDGITLIAIAKLSGEPPARATSLSRQLAKVALLWPLMIFGDTTGERTANFYRSLGVIRARTFGIPQT